MKKTDENYLNAKPVIELSLDGKTRKEYGSALEVAEVRSEGNKYLMGDYVRFVKRCCEGKKNSYRGRIYMYFENQWLSSEDPRSLEHKLGDRVHQFTTDGSPVTSFNTLKEASSITGIVGIGSCASGKVVYCRDSIFIYQKDLHTLKERVKRYREHKEISLKNSDDNRKMLAEKLSKPVVQLTLEGKFISRHSSARRAAEDLGLRQNGINVVLKGKSKHCGGFKWMYEESYLRNIKR